jgi:hypothetical protein
MSERPPPPLEDHAHDLFEPNLRTAHDKALRFAVEILVQRGQFVFALGVGVVLRGERRPDGGQPVDILATSYGAQNADLLRALAETLRERILPQLDARANEIDAKEKP